MTREEEINDAIETYMNGLFEDGVEIPIEDYENIEDAFEEGAKWADRFPKSSWISVKDDLPCNHKELIETIGTITGVPALIATQNRVTLGIRIKSKDDKWYWCDNSTTLSPMIEEVMFWMPIPKLPKRD